MLFYYSIVAFPTTAVMIGIDIAVRDEAFRFFDYNGEQYFFMIALSIVNFVGLNCQTIALQNERSGFITLLGYIGLVYAFLGDLIIFDETLAWLELLGILLLLSLITLELEQQRLAEILAQLTNKAL